jgi:hypothetical protein
MSMSTLDQEVDAFWAEKPQRSAAPATTRITCRVCDRKEDVPILSSGLLCALCRQDLDATERHIRETLEATELRLENAYDYFIAGLAQADEVDQARYGRVSEALDKAVMGELNRTEVELKYARAIAKGDGLSAILRSKEACDQVITEVERVRGWANAALEEVLAARSGDETL